MARHSHNGHSRMGNPLIVGSRVTSLRVKLMPAGVTPDRRYGTWHFAARMVTRQRYERSQGLMSLLGAVGRRWGRFTRIRGGHGRHRERTLTEGRVIVGDRDARRSRARNFL